MKNLILVTAFFMTLSAQASVSIISDLDDTIKITNADNLAEATYHGFFTTDTYSGMPLFLKNTRTYSNKLYVISAAPSFVKANIERLFTRHAIKVDQLFVRESLNDADKFKYKFESIKKIMQQNSDDFIFMGDDVEIDSKVYDAIKKLYPNRVLAIYIHSVKNRPIEKSAIRYWTTFDITLREVLANRMNPSAVADSMEHHLLETRLHHIMPVFAECPKEITPWKWQLKTAFGQLAGLVANRVVRYCRTRKVFE